MSGARQLDLWLQSREGVDLSLSLTDIPSTPFVVLVNGTAVPVLRIYDETATKKVVVQASVPESLIKGGTADIRITWPFYGESWTTTKRMSDPSGFYKIARFSATSLLITATDTLGFGNLPALSQTKHPLDQVWKLRAGTEIVNFLDGQPAYESLSTHAALISLAKIPEKVVLISPAGTPFVLDVPKAEDSETEKKSDAKQIVINQNDRIWQDIEVVDAKRVAEVLVDDKSLELYPPDPADRSSDKKLIKVKFPIEITKLAGNIELKVVYNKLQDITNIPPLIHQGHNYPQ